MVCKLDLRRNLEKWDLGVRYQIVPVLLNVAFFRATMLCNLFCWAMKHVHKRGDIAVSHVESTKSSDSKQCTLPGVMVSL